MSSDSIKQVSKTMISYKYQKSMKEKLYSAELSLRATISYKYHMRKLHGIPWKPMINIVLLYMIIQCMPCRQQLAAQIARDVNADMVGLDVPLHVVPPRVRVVTQRAEP